MPPPAQGQPCYETFCIEFQLIPKGMRTFRALPSQDKSFQMKWSKRLLQSTHDAASPDSSLKHREEPSLRKCITTLRSVFRGSRQRPTGFCERRIVGARLRVTIQCKNPSRLPVPTCSL